MRTLKKWREERGDTLVEVLLTMSIMGVAVIAILAGLGTAVRVSALHRGQANADVVLVSAADSVKAQTYVACPLVTTSSYDPDLNVTLPSGWSSSNISITSVSKWNGTAFQSSCPTTDQGLQLVTIQVVTPGPSSTATTETVEVLKRVKT